MNKFTKKLRGYNIKFAHVMFGLFLYGFNLNTQAMLLANHPTLQQSQTESSQADREVQKDIQRHFQQAEKATQETVIPEAVAIIEETKNAFDILTKAGREREAIAAIERATGKIEVLLARHKNTALLPVDFKVKIVDIAPLDMKKIRELNKTVHKAVEDKRYPESRILLKFLESEIHIHMKCLPLAIYPAALTEAARLLDQGNREQAQHVLFTALTTLATIDQAIPIPLIKIQTLLVKAAEKHQEDMKLALNLIADMENELERAKELGYLVDHKEYVELHREIKELEKHTKSHKSSSSAFMTLKEKIEEILKRFSYLNK